MKHVLLAVTAAIALGTATHGFAADLVTTPVAASYDWSGLYIGANGGWGSGHSCWDTTPFPGLTFDEGCHNATGATAGAQIGYRWQRNDWVFGVEAQGNWADLKGSNQSDIFPAFTNRSHVDWYGLLTGQIGYSFSNALVYAKGGVAVTGNHFDVVSTPSPDTLAGDADDQTRWGAVLGAGLEYGFAPNWSLGIEYDHLFMPDKDVTFTPVGIGGFAFGTDSISQSVDLVGLRLNYRFGG
ncbi:outer membrane beta-barrel protein [Mesorhizobium sp. B2-3-4]|uniref:outer membrane protein n=1 Tax=Mesorhizobium sp. B2-3-4 TaxID=2589959 RepID=UPI0011267A17|nr:outer membrane beta-barrel protein [Mesorhizobium sp. B2-3-4]TPM31509.1 porin family protein [Mesorhizobium sp. B2-3-4]